MYRLVLWCCYGNDAAKTVLNLLERDGEEEAAAASFCGGDSDSAAVQLHDALGDSQPQPGARTSLQLVRADLDEILEEFGLVFRRDTRPSIPHGKQEDTTCRLL